MMWRKTGLSKAPGDPWTARDANAYPTASEEAHPCLTAEHAPDGTHRPPCPIAAAVLMWDPSAMIYTLEARDGISGVFRITRGLVQYYMERPVSILRRMAVARPFDWHGDYEQLPVIGMEWAHQETDRTKTDQSGIIALIALGRRDEMDWTVGMAPRQELVDCSFILEVYGEPL